MLDIGRARAWREALAKLPVGERAQGSPLDGKADLEHPFGDRVSGAEPPVFCVFRASAYTVWHGWAHRERRRVVLIVRELARVQIRRSECGDMRGVIEVQQRNGTDRIYADQYRKLTNSR